MTYPTKEQFEEIFRKFSDEHEQKAISREARKLLAIVKDSEQFKSVLGGFHFELLKSMSPIGIVPEPMQMVVLLSFVLGCRWTEQQSGGGGQEPLLDQELINRMLAGMEPDKGEK